MKRRPQISPIQPEKVCRNCGGLWGIWWDQGSYFGPPHLTSIFKPGQCGVCGALTGVTEPCNYGYLQPGWHLYLGSVHLDGSNQPSNEGSAQAEVQGQAF